MTDTFRQEYKTLSQETKDYIFLIKTKANELMEVFNKVGINNTIDNRSISLAKTNLEQAVMWAVKSIT